MSKLIPLERKKDLDCYRGSSIGILVQIEWEPFCQSE